MIPPEKKGLLLIWRRDTLTIIHFSIFFINKLLSFLIYKTKHFF